MNRSHPANTLLIALAFFLQATLCRSATAADPPNIIILFADDLGYGSVGWYGGDIPTPHIDSIAHNGVGFTSGYVTAPVCNPSRAGLMTGRYQQRWGKEMNSQTQPPLNSPRGSLPLSETTLAAALKKQGYATAAIGKWQLGMAKGYHPLDRGFDYFFGMASGSRFVNSDWPDARIAPRFKTGREEEGEAGRLRELFDGRQAIELDEYLTDKLGKAGVGFIERHKDQPFFLYQAFYAPHVPTETIDKYYQRFPHTPNEDLRIYMAQISAVDDWVGRILAKVREHGLEENTLIFFTSDNGAAEYSDSDGKRNHPMLGHKRNLYEGGIHIPYMMQWKSTLDKGTRFTHPVSTLDIFPTALSAAGAEDLSSYKLDGANLLPYLTADSEEAPHDYLVWRSGPNAAVRKGDWKLLIGENGLLRLYNTAEDVSESKDQSSGHPGLVKELQGVFERWTKDKQAPRRSQRTIKTNYNGDVFEWHI
ncbi:MAG: sulfatase-like hydrolase/transferase [Planctomycetota bacterium]|jgi:arylsulfatase A-like enzyme